MRIISSCFKFLVNIKPSIWKIICVLRDEENKLKLEIENVRNRKGKELILNLLWKNTMMFMMKELIK